MVLQDWFLLKLLKEPASLLGSQWLLGGPGLPWYGPWEIHHLSLSL